MVVRVQIKLVLLEDQQVVMVLVVEVFGELEVHLADLVLPYHHLELLLRMVVILVGQTHPEVIQMVGEVVEVDLAELVEMLLAAALVDLAEPVYLQVLLVFQHIMV